MTGIINHGKLCVGKMRHINLFLLFVFLLGLEGVKGMNDWKRTIFKCADFQDNRSNFDGHGHDDNLTIPANLSSRGEDSIFILKPGNLVCDGETIETTIFLDDGLMLSPSSINSTTWARDFRKLKDARKELPRHFTADGHFFDGEYFLSPETDYCVNSISDDKLELQLCPQKCDGRSKNKICFPKCCAIDEVFMWTKCIKLNETDGRYLKWKPEFYQKQWYGNYKRLSEQSSNKNVKFFLANIPPDCNVDEKGPFLRYDTTIDQKEPTGKFSIPKSPVRLILDRNGNVKPLSFAVLQREWVVDENVKFCVDAVIDINGGSDQIRSDAFWYFYCAPPDDGSFEAGQATARNISTVYITFSLISVPFQLLTVVIYLILLDKLNLHGLTILSYCIAEFMAFALLIVAQLNFLLKWEWMGVHEKGWPCYLIAISAHFYMLASYTWVLVMNFDLWMAFRSLRVVKRDTKVPKKFALYSLVGWGLPFLLVLSFAIVDKIYDDPISEVPVPNYGYSTCFVAPCFRGLYVYVPVAIIISCNILLILLTLKIFLDARRQNKETLGDSSARVNATQYSAKLFGKLFLVMGGSSIVDFISWYYTEDQAKRPWAVVILESFYYLVPIVLFYIFCANEKILSLLQERFPGLKELLKPVWKMLSKGDRNSTSSADTTLTTHSSINKSEKRRMLSSGKISYE